MEKPRPLFLVILGVAVLVLIYLLVIKGGGDNSDPPPEPATQTQTQTQPSTPDVPTTTTPPDTSTTKKDPEPDSSSSEPSPLSLPPSVASAMLKGKVVVVLFWSPKGPVDRRAKKSVDRLRKSQPKSKVAVFYASPDEIADYSFIAGDLSQTPAIVVVDRAYKTKVVEGFIDYTSILQMVREARKVPPA